MLAKTARTSGHGARLAKVPMKGTRVTGATAMGSSTNGASRRAGTAR
ncbi:MAG: hypothetical protein IPJ65_23085 [Archangiaceae bacterium]|nr:hypothetical protein [Archangiaceae bacterium]